MKKGSTQVGIAIIAMAALLLLGSIFLDDSQNTNYISDNKIELNNNKSTENMLFYLNETNLGRQNRVIQNFPNIQIGSVEEFKTIKTIPSFRLYANPFSNNNKNIYFNIENPNNIKQILLYFNNRKLSGERELEINFNDKLVTKTLAKPTDMPISIYDNIKTNNNISFEMDKPKFYSLFSWNKADLEDLRIVVLEQDLTNSKREVNFLLDKMFLDRVYLEVLISCHSSKNTNHPININVNDYILTQSNIDCNSRETRLTLDIPLNILKEKNSIIFDTMGHFTVSYSINKIYYNDRFTYTFNVNDFSDILDIILYGDFDNEVIDLRINGELISLHRNEIKSIIPLIRFGTNEINILTKPLEIKEFAIEKSSLNLRNR